jgi:hypothetical protein
MMQTMSSGETGGLPGEPKLFVVGSETATPEAILAMREIVGDLGWMIRPYHIGDENIPATFLGGNDADDWLMDMSDDIFGTPDYGQLATGFLADVQRGCTGRVWQRPPGARNDDRSFALWYSPAVVGLGSAIQPMRMSLRRGPDARALLAKHIEQSLFTPPFGVTIEWLEEPMPVDADRTQVGTVDAGPLERNRLKEFVRTMGYDRSEQRGSFGRMFAVLAVASGVRRSREIRPVSLELEQPTMAVADMVRILKDDFEASPPMIDTLRDKISVAIGNLLWARHNPWPIGLEADGMCGFDSKRPKGLVIDSVALTLGSLRAIAGTYTTGGSPMPDILRSLVGSAEQAWLEQQ